VGGRDRCERRRGQLGAAPESGVARERLVDRDLGAIDAEQVGGGGGVLADVVAGG